MEAKELRIGNYVYDRGNKILKIDFFDYVEEGYNCKFGMANYFNGELVHPFTEYTDYAKPIPLTEEWLLKFGFEKTENYKYSDDSIDYIPVFTYYNYLIKNYENELWGFCQMKGNNIKAVLTTKIKYVHQLQNLYFALTGEELILN